MKAAGRIARPPLLGIPISVFLIGFFFSIYSLTIRDQISYGDEAARFLEAKSLVENHSFEIPPIPDTNKIGIDGKNYNRFEFGYEILLIPPYALGRAVSDLISSPDQDWLPLLFIGMLNALITALTCLVLFWFSRDQGIRQNISLWITFLFGLATLAWPYSQGVYRESLQSLLLLLSIYGATMYRQSGRASWFWISAISLGYLVFTKTSDLVLFPVILVYMLLDWHRDSLLHFRTPAKVMIRKGLVFSIPLVALALLQALVTLAKFGTLFELGPKYDNNLLAYFSTSNLLVGVTGLLFSASSSLFIYSPPIILFLPAVVGAFKFRRREVILILSLVAIDILFYSSYLEWAGGSFWGTRYLVEIVPLMILAIGMTLESATSSRRRQWLGLTVIAFILGLFVQIAGTLTSAREYLDVTGQRIDLAGAIDFLSNGGIDSIAFSLSPEHGALQFNSYAWFSLAIVVVFGMALFSIWRDNSPAGARAWSWRGLLLLTIALGAQVGALVEFLGIPYAQIRSEKGDTKYVAAGHMFEDGRYCESQSLYLAALFWHTGMTKETLARLDEISPITPGNLIEFGDLDATGSEPAELEISEDHVNTIVSENSLKLHASGSSKVTGGTATDFFPLRSATDYEFSGWSKAEGIHGSGHGFISWYEDDGAWRSPRTIDAVWTTETHGWQPFRKTIVTLPKTRRALLKVGMWQAEGTMWLDGLRLVEIDQSHRTKSLCAR